MVDRSAERLVGQQIALRVGAARCALVFVIVIGNALGADARKTVQIQLMLRREQLFHGIDIVARQQIGQAVLPAGIEIKGKAVVPDRRACAASADAVRPHDEHAALDGRAVGTLERLVFRRDRRALEEERADVIVDALLHLCVRKAADLREIDVPAVLGAVRLISHELLVVHGFGRDAAAEVERGRLRQQRPAGRKIDVFRSLILRHAHDVFAQERGIFRVLQACKIAAVLFEEDQAAVRHAVPRKTVAQLVEPADIAHRAVGDVAVRVHRRGRTVLAPRGIQAVSHVAEVVIRRSSQQLSVRADQAPAVDLAHHRRAVTELGDRLIEKIREIFALRDRVQRAVRAVGHDDRIAAVDRVIYRVSTCVERRFCRAGGVDDEIGAVQAAHERETVRERARSGIFRREGRRAVLLHKGIPAGLRISAQQQPVLKKALSARIGTKLRAGERVVDAVIGVAVGDHAVREIDRDRRLGVVDDQLSLAVNDCGLPFFVLDRRKAAGREFSCAGVGEGQHGTPFLVEITRTGHAVDVRAARREDISHSARRRHHGEHRKNGAQKFFHHSSFPSLEQYYSQRRAALLAYQTGDRYPQLKLYPPAPPETSEPGQV